MNTGLTLRTAQIQDGVASVRAGATLLYDSDPDAEERETHLKAQALLDALAPLPNPIGRRRPDDRRRRPAAGGRCAGTSGVAGPPGDGLQVLLVDHQDSFVHTLADYFRQQGAEVTTLRFGFAEHLLDDLRARPGRPLPGPGRPRDFDCAGLLRAVDARGLPAFGVCLGLQAMVEHDGGRAGVLPDPAHGKPARSGPDPGRGPGLLAGLGATFAAGATTRCTRHPSRSGGFEVTAVLTEPGGGRPWRWRSRTRPGGGGRCSSTRSRSSPRPAGPGTR